MELTRLAGSAPSSCSAALVLGPRRLLGIVWQEKDRGGAWRQANPASPAARERRPHLLYGTSMQMNARLAHRAIDMGWNGDVDDEWLPNGLEMSRPASQG